jgi:hypothetical protein
VKFPGRWTLSPAQMAAADAMWKALVETASEGQPVSVKARLDGLEVVVLGSSLGPPMGGYRMVVPLVVVIDKELQARLETEHQARQRGEK